MRLRFGGIVLAACLASLAGWAPVRDAEQVLALLFRPTDWLVVRALPEPEPEAQTLPGDRSRAAPPVQAVGEAWREAVGVGARMPGREARVVSVVSRDPARREVVLRVPPGALELDAPVTHRGALLGFVRPWREGDPAIDVDGRVRVALLGHSRARPVAGAWALGSGGAAVSFVLVSSGGTPRVEHVSRAGLQPAPGGQLAFTRDVQEFGASPVPSHLLLGRLHPVHGEVPGGGLPEAQQPRLEPLVDIARVDHVAVSVAPGSGPAPLRTATARVRPGGSAGRWRLDAGRLDGLAPGDVVAHEGHWLGTLGAVGPLSSTVHWAPPRTLLVADDEDVLVPVDTSLVSEAGDRLGHVGRRVFTAHPELGGLVVGTVQVTSDGLRLVPPRAPAGSAVTVAEP